MAVPATADPGAHHGAAPPQVPGGESRRRMRRLARILVELGVAGAAAFAVQMVLAWELAADSYGIASLVLGGLLTLRLCGAALADGSLPAQGWLSLALALLAAGVLAALGRATLVLPVALCFLAWQLNDALRRRLLHRMRHRAALPGDLAGQGGQAICLLLLARAGQITVETAFLAMAGCALLGAAAHGARLGLGAAHPAADDAAAGSPPSPAGSLLAQARMLVVPLVLAGLDGPAAAAGFAACMNVVGLVDPVLLGLGRIVPRLAARAVAAGQDAWRMAGPCILVAAVPVALYSATVAVMPSATLHLFYGAASPYAAQAVALQLLVAAAVASFLAEGVVACLHGLARRRHALAINLAGTAATVLLAWPGVRFYGLEGGCAALLAGSLVRLVSARICMVRLGAPVSHPA